MNTIIIEVTGKFKEKKTSVSLFFSCLSSFRFWAASDYVPQWPVSIYLVFEFCATITPFCCWEEMRFIIYYPLPKCDEQLLNDWSMILEKNIVTIDEFASLFAIGWVK